MNNGTKVFLIASVGVVVLSICACIACISLGGLTIFGIVAATQPVVDAGNDFFIEAKEGDWPTAYGLASNRLQSELGSAENLQVFFTDQQPQDWSFNSRSITNQTGEVSGTMTDKDGDKFSVTLTFIQDGDDWKVNSILLTPQ